MTEAQFQKWSKNGNLTLPANDSYLTLVNHLSEDEKLTPTQLRHVAIYLNLSLLEAQNDLQLLKLNVLRFATSLQ